METEAANDIRYALHFCQVAQKEVWTIRKRGVDGKWRLTGCCEEVAFCPDGRCLWAEREGDF